MHPSLESWQLACALVQAERLRLDKYLQWYPFSNLSIEQWEVLKAEEYYSAYIQDGSFILAESMRFTTKGYLQKQGITLRDSTLVSPILFLYLLAFGLEYVQVFEDPRNGGVCLYSGDLNQKWLHYRKSYQAFVDSTQFCSEMYEHCIKTDITNFFGSINVDILLTEMQMKSGGHFSSTDALFIRSLLLYCGKGGYPTIQNHPTLSFLGTQVYLSGVDVALCERLSCVSGISSFELVRYVDDLYIFFNLEEENALTTVSHAVVNIYADLLRDQGLALKQEKLQVLTRDEVKISTATISMVDFTGSGVDEEFIIEDKDIADFFSSIDKAIEEGDYSQEILHSLIEMYFMQDGFTVPAISLFRQCLFKRPSVFQNELVIAAVDGMLSKGNMAFTFNTSELILGLLHTRDETLIKKLLNNLFAAERDGSWSSLDCLIALTYLQQRKMKHKDLLALLSRQDQGLSQYCSSYCVNNFVNIEIKPNEEKMIDLLREDAPSKIQFAFFLQNDRIGNSFEKASYYRSFFDRVTSHISAKRKGKKLTWLYDEKKLSKVFTDTEAARRVIHDAERLRRNNPIIHASSEIIERPTYKKELDDLVVSLSSLLDMELLADDL